MRYYIPPVTKHLLIINIIMFIATQLNPVFMFKTFAMFYPASPLFQPWQVVTHMFMHGNFMHIFFNMYSLFLFGSVMEQSIGPRKYVIFYFLCGLGAVALHTGVEAIQFASVNSVVQYEILSTPTVGASGAIYGLFVGYAMLYPNNIISLIFPPVSLKAKWMMLIFVTIELVIGIFQTNDGVAHFAHLGGVAMGVLLLLFWKKSGRIWLRDKWL